MCIYYFCLEDYSKRGTRRERNKLKPDVKLEQSRSRSPRHQDQGRDQDRGHQRQGRNHSHHRHPEKPISQQQVKEQLTSKSHQSGHNDNNVTVTVKNEQAIPTQSTLATATLTADLIIKQLNSTILQIANLRNYLPLTTAKSSTAGPVAATAKSSTAGPVAGSVAGLVAGSVAGTSGVSDMLEDDDVIKMVNNAGILSPEYGPPAVAPPRIWRLLIVKRYFSLLTKPVPFHNKYLITCLKTAEGETYYL